MLGKVIVFYPDGTRTWATVCEDGNGVYFIVAKTRFSVEDVTAMNATFASNNAEIIRKLSAHGFAVRPTPMQEKLSIAVAPELKEELKDAAKEDGVTISDIVNSLIKAWLASRR